MTLQIDIYSTEQEQAAEKIPYWNRISSKLVGAATVQPFNGSLKSSIERRTVGAIQLLYIRSSPIVVESFGDERFKGVFILKNHQGQCDVTQGGVRCSLSQNQLCVISACAPYGICSKQQHTVQIMHLPLPSLAAQLQNRTVQAYGREQCSLLHAFLDKMLATKNLHSANLLQTALAIIDLEWPMPERQDKKKTAQLRAESVIEYITLNLTDPMLSINSLAKALGLSPRYLQKIFAAQGSTLARYLSEQRLALARRYLQESSRSVTDIAMACGFSDTSYFCRLFKQHFRQTARECRLQTNGLLKTPITNHSSKNHSPINNPLKNNLKIQF